MSKVKLEYIWMDGHQPTQKLRSKTKTLTGPINGLSDLPDWGFDGSIHQLMGQLMDQLIDQLIF